jgi:diguanylate cyclase (GGDEF)-like protein
MSATTSQGIGISAMTSRLLEYLSDPDVSLATIVNVISTDATLSKKLQDAANSVAFGQGRFSNDLRTAIAMLGWNQVTSLAVCFSLHNESLMKRDRSGVYQRMWLQAIIQASAGGLVGSKKGMSHKAECFLASLLAKAGELTSLMTPGPGQAEASAEVAEEEPIADPEAIRASTVELLEQWHVPARYVDAIRNAGMPLCGLRVLPAKDSRDLIYAVALAEAVGCYFCDEHKGYALIRVHELCSDLFQMSATETQALLDEVQLRLRECSRLFNVDVSALMSRADRMVEAMAQIAEMRQPKVGETDEPGTFTVSFDEHATADGLLGRTVIDSVSGVFSRNYFDEQIPHLARMARDRRQSLGLVLIDVDHLRTTNEQCGIEAGDAVLRQVAAAIVQTVRGCDLVARYDGDEFAVVVVNASIEGLQVLANRMRAAVSKIKSSLGTSAPAISISGGAALVTPTTNEKASAETLKTAAGRALSAAQKKGRHKFEVETAPNSYVTVA